MPGFSRDDQHLLAAILLGHRRKIARDDFRRLGVERGAMAMRLCVLLRLAARLNRSRSSAPPPELQVTANKSRIGLQFPPKWLEQHPLTRADLAEEAEALGTIGVVLKFG